MLDGEAAAAHCPTAWRAQHLRLGIALGLGLGLVSQVAVAALAPRTHLRELSLGQRAAGVLFTAAGYALLGLVLGALSAGLLRWSRGRWLGAAVTAAAMTALFACHATGVVVRVLSGSWVTTGAIEFALASPDHFMHAATASYLRYGAALLGACAVFAALVAVALVRGGRAAAGPRAGARLTRVGWGLGGVMALGLVPLPRATFFEGVRRATPELALLSSIDRGGGLAVQPARDGVSGAPRPAPAAGPPRAAAALWRRAVQGARGDRPNVLLLTLESVPAGHLGYAGYARPVTPNLDRLAAHSLRMRRAYTSATHSNYAQMAILSSLFPRRGRELDMYERLDYPRFLFHDLFHELGYRTATISSQDESWQGMRRFEDTGTPTFFRDARDATGPRIDIGAELAVPDQVTADLAVGWIGGAPRPAGAPGARPWALYVNLQLTHFPYQLPDGARARWAPADPSGEWNFLRWPEDQREVVLNRYDNALAYVDAQVGRIERWLRETGQLGRTLWVITADHGESFHEHGVVTHGKTLREPEARVPLLLHWPDRVEPGDVHEPVSSLDVMPTIAELIGIPPHPSFQGTSFAPGGPAAARAGVFMNMQGFNFAEGLVCWPYKLTVDRMSGQVELYDLDRDPGELDDRSERDPSVTARLAEVLAAQMEAQEAYHHPAGAARAERFAPRLLACPAL